MRKKGLHLALLLLSVAAVVSACGTRTVVVERTVVSSTHQLRPTRNQAQHSTGTNRKSSQETLKQNRVPSSESPPTTISVLLKMKNWRIVGSRYDKPYPLFTLEKVGERHVASSVIVILKEPHSNTLYEMPVPEIKEGVRLAYATIRGSLL